ncbi:hypothetical protein NMP99_04910 [Glutamicibacter mishrai]|uniref:hypothetical protein n=1 Tax=Glutamicibacter mishrai TaxID=1775880 RepID=UPI0020CD53DC|nr:hypothetical protein [Glutamicibacter mishrai]UTT40629.1 hypothetical protein NMP99_04910 [Glutamicibacter mishrai]
MINASRGLKAFGVVATLGLLLTGCSEPKTDLKTLTPTVVPSPSKEAPKIKSLRDADLANATWIDPMAIDGKASKIRLKNSKGSDEFNSYKLGKIVYADLNGDGVDDAVAELSSTSGNAYWGHYVAWVATADGPVQVPGELGYTHNCGSTVKSVDPAKQGVKITEYLRSDFEESACSENGPIKQVRTVGVSQFTGDDHYYLVRKDGVGGYGGYCHLEGEGDTISVSIPVYSAPNAKSKMPLQRQEMMGYMAGPEATGTVTKDGQWTLAAVLLRDEQATTGMKTRCAWMPTTKNPLHPDGEPVLGENGKAAG